MVVVVRDGCGWQEIRLGLKIGEDENRKWRFHVCVFGFGNKDVFIIFWRQSLG